MLSGSGVDRVLQFFAGLELWRLAGRYLFRFAGPRVPPWARRSVGDAERSKAGQVDLLAARQRRCDRGQCRIQGLGNGSVGLVSAGGDGGDQVGLVHGGARRADGMMNLTTPRRRQRQHRRPPSITVPGSAQCVLEIRPD